jgi:hypothetical protein
VETEHGNAPKGLTLATYIEDNQKLLTVLGVFTALTGFSTNLPIKLFGVVLSFCCMGIALLVLVQLWLRFPAYPEDISTTLFKLFLFVAMLTLFLYWLVAFTTVWSYALPLIVGMLTFSLLSTLALWLDRLLARRRTDLAAHGALTRGPLARLQTVFLLASLILSTLAAVFLAPYLIDLLRVLRQLVEPFAHNP